MRIPKVIHYCWYGKKTKPQLVEDCIASWQKKLPDYKIIEWNEENTDLKHPFIRRAYRQKKWAFVSDFVRFQVLHEFGGVYLDTDMLILKPLDDFLNDECFLGTEDANHISAGIIGATRSHPFIQKCLSEYDAIKMKNETDWSVVTVPKIITRIFRYHYDCDSLFKEKLNVGDVVIYPSPYFYPLSLKNKGSRKNYENYLTKDSHAVHLWNASWIEPNEFQYLRNKQYYKGFKKVSNNIISNRKISFFYFRKILSALKQSLGSKRKQKLM